MALVGGLRLALGVGLLAFVPKVLDLGNGVILVIAFLGPTLAWTRRRDLVGKVFFSHYEPRLRDNERWAIDGLPLRGGPVSA